MDPVSALVGDYLERIKARAADFPLHERNDLVRELESHIQDSYAHSEGEPGVEKMLGVLRRLGEPSEVVAEHRRPQPRREIPRVWLPVRLLFGGFLAFVSIPVTFATVGAVTYVLFVLGGLVAGFFAASAGMVTAGLLSTVTGFVRIYRPDWLELLSAAGVLHVDTEAMEALAQLPAGDQGLLLITAGVLVASIGILFFRAGQYAWQAYRSLLGKVWWAAKRVGRRAKTVAGQWLPEIGRLVTPY